MKEELSSDTVEEKVLFHESQHFSRLWLSILLVGVWCFFLLIIPTEDYSEIRSISDIGAIFTPVFASIILLFLISIRLDTKIKQDGIYVRFFPINIKYRKYSWRMLDKVFVRKYSALFEFGGWGIRGITNRNRAFNIWGNTGIQLVKKNGNKLLIGTQKSEEAKEVLNLIEQNNFIKAE